MLWIDNSSNIGYNVLVCNWCVWYLDRTTTQRQIINNLKSKGKDISLMILNLVQCIRVCLFYFLLIWEGVSYYICSTLNMWSMQTFTCTCTTCHPPLTSSTPERPRNHYRSGPHSHCIYFDPSEPQGVPQHWARF